MPARKKKPVQPRTLGEFLLQKKLLSWEAIERAMRRTYELGGHLATSLAELGLLDEKSLSRALADASGTPCAPAGAFERIGDEVLGRLPPELVERHRAVPFDVKKKVVQVAFIDPGDTTAVEDIATAAGGKIRTWIAPEPRVLQAIERYYGVPREHRQVLACQTMDGLNAEAEPLPAPSSARTGPATDGPALIDPSGALEDHPGVTVLAEPDLSPDEILYERMCGAESVQDLAEAALDFVQPHIPRSALFAVKADVAKVWATRGFALNAETAKGFEVALNCNPVFQLLTIHDHYRGPIPQDADYQRFYASADLSLPSEALLVPGHMDDRIRLILYGDSGDTGEIRGDTRTYVKLAGRLALALRMIVLKNRIRIP